MTVIEKNPYEGKYQIPYFSLLTLITPQNPTVGY